MYSIYFGQQGAPKIGCKKTKKKLAGCQYGEQPEIHKPAYNNFAYFVLFVLILSQNGNKSP